ncbi:hypothetical protein TNCV_2296661 [Trichonephila clavipes]|nr:hypothetical protein TNCV_2296661 [Trichonephila clavipes]
MPSKLVSRLRNEFQTNCTIIKNLGHGLPRVTTPSQDHYLELGSNPVKDVDVSLCIVPSRHGDTLNSCRASSSLMRLVGGPDPPPGCSPSNLGWNQAKSYCLQYGAQGYDQRQAYI